MNLQLTMRNTLINLILLMVLLFMVAGMILLFRGVSQPDKVELDEATKFCQQLSATSDNKEWNYSSCIKELKPSKVKILKV